MPTKPTGDKPRKKDPPPDASKTTSSGSGSSSQQPVKSDSGGSGDAAMGARWSGGGAAGSSGKAPSTISGSSTHTASTVPADSADGKSKSSTLPSRGSGVTSFLRKKPSTKGSSSAADRRRSDPVPEAGASGEAKKSPKKAGTLRTALFKRKSKAPADDVAAPGADKGRPPTGRGTGSPPKAARPASRTSIGSAEAPAPKRKTPSPAARKSPSPAPRKSPSPSAGAAGKAPTSATAKATDASKDASGQKAAASVPDSISPDKPADGGAGRGRGSKALTPAQKEALKKQWFTEGQPAPPPQPAPRSSARLAAARAGETAEPPAKVSRVSNAAAKFGPTVKAAPKARPASPKKPGRAGRAGSGSDKSPEGAEQPFTSSVHSKIAAEKPGASAEKSTAKADKVGKGDVKSTTAAEKQGAKEDKSNITAKNPSGDSDMGDFMDAMSGFKPMDTSASKLGGKVSVAAAAANVPAEEDQGRPKADEKASGGAGKHSGANEGMEDLMDAMSGFNPEGSNSSDKSDVKQKDSTSDSKHSDKSANPKDAKPETTSTSSVSASGGVASPSEGAAPAAAANLVNKVVDKAVLIASDDAADPKSDKTSLRALGEEDTGELGLGGISQKDRKEWAERPKPPKATEADLDFLSTVIDTAPKAPTKKVTPPKAQKKDGKGQGLNDLMELSMGLDMSSKPKFEETSSSAAKPNLASGDMDKFLDLMSSGPVESTASMPMEEVTEEPIKEKKWKVGEDDDEKMNELRKKKRDFDAPAQAPDWDIDDLLVDAVPTKPAKADTTTGGDGKKEKPKAGGGAGDKGFSGFDDFLSSSLSTPEIPEKVEKHKPSATDKTKDSGKASDDKGFSGFDDFLSDSLSASVSPPASHVSPSKEEVISAPKQSTTVDTAPKSSVVEETISAPKKASGVASAPKPSSVDEEILSAVAVSQTTAAPGGKPKNRHVEKEGNTRGSVPDHDHGVRDVLYDDSDKTGKKNSDSKQKDKSKSRPPAVLDDLILPAKASSTSSAPTQEDTVVAHSAATTEAGAPSSGKTVAGKHVDKEGNTRGSVPDHGHGVRGVLYDDHDKTGLGKKDGSKAESKPRDPVLLDDLVQPKKAAASHSEPHEAVVAASTAHQSHGKPSKNDKAAHSEKASSSNTSHKEKDCTTKICDKQIEKHGDTRGSCPDHGHGVRDVLYDDSDKTGRAETNKTKDNKPREPAVLDELVLPKKANASHAAPHEEVMSAKTAQHSHSEPTHKHDEKVHTAEKAHATEAAHKEKDRDRKASEKHVEKHGDTRGSCPDHGHGVRDVLYDDSDKTGKGKPSNKKEDKQPREPVVLDDLVLPKKAGVSHAAPHEKAVAAETAHHSHSEPSKKHEEKLSAEKAHATESSHKEKDTGKKAREKHVEKHGDTRGSCPDHGHGVRDVLYDDSDKTGRGKKDSTSKGSDNHREPVVLDDLIRPKQAGKVTSAAPAQRSPSPDSEDDEDDDEHVTATTAQHTESAAPALSKSKKRRNRKKNKAKLAEKEGNTRGSVPDHGHGARDVLYDDSDKTGHGKPSGPQAPGQRQPADLDALIRPAHASSSSSAPTSSPSAATAGQEAPLVAATATVAHSAPPGAEGRKKPKQSLSLFGMTDPDDDSDSDGGELRRLIASTEALQHQLHACGVLADGTQAEAAQAAAGRELEQLESQLHRREAKLAAGGKQRPELQAAKDQLLKAKEQLGAGKAKK